MNTRLIFLFLLTTSLNVLAENSLFSIQITATEAPNLTFYKETTGFDTLYSEETKSGLVRIKLGSYTSRKEAERDLTKIKNKGFPDAFVTSYTGKKLIKSAKLKKSPLISRKKTTIINKPKENAVLSPSSNEEVTISEPKENKLLPPSSSPAWSKLTEAQKRNVVYVDGILHLHEGDKFIPLSSF